MNIITQNSISGSSDAGSSRRGVMVIPAIYNPSILLLGIIIIISSLFGVLTILG
jgi:hypothetical protein